MCAEESCMVSSMMLTYGGVAPVHALIGSTPKELYDPESSNVSSNASDEDESRSNEYSTSTSSGDAETMSKQRAVSTRKRVNMSHVERSPQTATHILDQITNDYQKCVLGYAFFRSAKNNKEIT